MIAPQQFGCYPVFGCAATKCEPNPVKYETGYIPGDVLPAEHLNWFLGNDTAGYNLLCAGVSSIEQELATVLSCAGCTPDPTSCSQVYNAVLYQINACITACSAPKAHASSETTYGVGNADCYGHLKLSDTFDSVLSACSGVAASQYALATVYACLSASGAQLGNTAGCALGTASAGTCNTAARSDHVHPTPTKVACADCGKDGASYSAFGSNAFNSTAFTTCKGTVTVSNKAAANSATPIALCTGATAMGRSTGCPLTFNTCLGTLYADNFFGLAEEAKLATEATHAGCAECATNATNATCATSATCAQRACLYANAVMLTRDCCSCSSCCCPLRLVNNCSFNVVAIMHIRCTSCSWYNLVGDYIAGTYVPANGCVTLGCSTTNTGTQWCVCGLRVK